MNILLLTEFFPDSNDGEITGGVEARCFYVSRYLQKFGNKVQIISRPKSKWSPATFSSLPERIIFTGRMILTGLKSDFDIVEGTNYTNHLVAALLGFLKQKPVVCWYADVFAGEWVKNVGLVGILGEIAERALFILPFVNYIAISKATKEKLIKQGVSPGKIKIIYCGAEKGKIKKQAIKYDLCAVSRLLPYKHLDDLIYAADGLKVAIIGQGPMMKKLKIISGKNIKFFGFVPKHTDVLKIISSSKIFCHPSTVEGFGIAIIEAAGLGTPYIAADIPVIREVTHNGLGGLLFKPESVEDLKAKIKKLLENKNLYDKKVKEAKTLAKYYDWQEIAGQTEKFYESLYSH